MTLEVADGVCVVAPPIDDFYLKSRIESLYLCKSGRGIFFECGVRVSSKMVVDSYDGATCTKYVFRKLKVIESLLKHFEFNLLGF